jgi:L-serine dehydratase
MPLTVSEMVAIATEYKARVVDVVLLETELCTGLSGSKS